MPRSQLSLLPQSFFGEDFSPMISRMRRAIDSALQDVWEPVAPLADLPRQFQPTVAVSEDDREIRVQAELPGIKESDIEITYEPGYLILKGEKKKSNANQNCEEPATLSGDTEHLSAASHCVLTCKRDKFKLTLIVEC